MAIWSQRPFWVAWAQAPIIVITKVNLTIMRNSNCFSTSALKFERCWYFQLISSNDNYYLSQSKYVYDFISRIDLICYKFANTPLGTNERCHSLDGEPFHDATLYWAQQINALPSKKQYAMVEQQLVSSFIDIFNFNLSLLMAGLSIFSHSHSIAASLFCTCLSNLKFA